MSKSRWAVALALVAVGCSDSRKTLNFTTTPPATVTAGATYSYQAAVTGANAPITYKLLTAPSGMAVSGSGLVSWKTTAANVGSHSVSLQAVAGHRSGTRNWTLQVTAASPATAPDPTAGDTVLHVNWRDSVEASGAVPEVVSARVHGGARNALEWYGFRWTDELGHPDLTSASRPQLNSWRNAETRAAFLAMVESFAAMAQPAWIFLGNRVDPPEAEFDDDEWDVWLDVVDRARIVVATASPTTVVFSRAERGR